MSFIIWKYSQVNGSVENCSFGWGSGGNAWLFHMYAVLSRGLFLSISFLSDHIRACMLPLSVDSSCSCHQGPPPSPFSRLGKGVKSTNFSMSPYSKLSYVRHLQLILSLKWKHSFFPFICRQLQLRYCGDFLGNLYHFQMHFYSCTALWNFPLSTTYFIFPSIGSSAVNHPIEILGTTRWSSFWFKD